jgi:hypothetical protein
MADFDDLRDQLAAHRSEREQARVDALLAAEAVRSLERTLTTARRSAGDDDVDVRNLGEQHRQAAGKAKEASARLADIDGRGVAIVEGISVFTDPVEGVSRLSDRHPILLMPLRLETRFKTSPTGQPQLWVRVYPDECLVDGFEESLTETEVRAGTAFWAAIWRACGDEGRERAAWRELVATCGSGRAGWIVRRLVPANPVDKPDAEEGTVRLILVAADPQPAAVFDYWSAVWTAHGDGAALALARTALDAALGSTAAADAVVANPPVNIDEAVPDGVATPVAKVTVLRLADPSSLPLRTTSWSSPPRVETLPDRFVLLAYDGAGDAPVKVELSNPVTTPLIAGPDPNAPPSEQLKPAGTDPDHPDTLQIPEDLRWMFDFEKALEVGMAFRFDLTADQARLGFERLLVVGVRLTDTADAGAQALARLMEHHLYSRKGLEFLRQGTPTNDSESGGSGHSWREDPDASFEPFFKQVAQYTRVADPLDVSDGQHFADGLGLADSLVSRIPGAGLTDRAEAHAMQIALWPATIGYFMDSLMEPVFTDATVAATRQFFTQQVSGRGSLPALRIGMQPYGIQPTVAFPRLSWFDDRQSSQTTYFAEIVALIRRVEADYAALLPRVSRIGADHEDSHQALLDVLGLHPTSVEYYPLGADSLEHKTYELSFFAGTLVEKLMDMFPNEESVDLLRRLGYTGTEIPDLLTKIYRSRQKPLDGPLVDDIPLSETARIRASAGGRNYIEWLVAAAQDSVEAVQAEQGFDGNKRPAALLYLLLRHAVQLGFHETAVDLLLQAGAAPSSLMLRKEPAFVHIADESLQPSESRYAVLFQADQRVTDNVDLPIGDYIARHARQLDQTLLPEHLAALDRLAKLPTARLERLFAEHIDTVSYRLDAWKTGIIDFGLQRMRATQRGNRAVNHGPADGGVATGNAAGLYLGAYGWVEQLRPEGKDLHAVDLPTELADVVNAHDSVPLMKDPTNLGLIHTPSINHAATAAVLRNAYVAHSGEISVNLSSRRVRAALAILEGMRGGQSLGALLGYQFERYVHDNGPLTVRALVYPMRREYPLATNQIQATATTDGAAKESIAAMNVVDGRKLVMHVEQSGVDVYPFANSNLPRRSAVEEDAITAGVRYIRDINDAVADLVVSEGVHQAVLGNYDRSAGTLDAFAKGNTPPEPEVIRTPRSGTTLTLRTGIHLPLTGGNPVSPIPMTPLAKAEPALNTWLADRLPDPAKVAVLVDYIDHATGMPATEPITQADLGLQPADLLYRADARLDQALGDLDDRILARLHAVAAVTIDQPITIRHTTRIPGSVTFFELEGLLRSLRRLVVGARPLRPADLVRQGDARTSDQSTVTVPLARLSIARDALRDTHLPAFATVAAQVVDPLRTVDEVIGLYEDAVSPLAAFRIPGAGTGFAFEWRAGAYVAMTKLLTARIAEWDGRLTSYTAVMAEYTALPGTATAEAQLQLLRTAEALVSTTVSSGLAPPAQLLAVTAKHDALVVKRGVLEQITTVPRATLADLATDAVAASDTSAFDHDALDLSAPLADIERFRDELTGAVTRLTEQVQHRIDAADAAITRHATAAVGEQADVVIAGLRAVFGEDFVSVPSFTLPAAAASELVNAVAHSRSGGLTKHLTDAPPAGSGRDFPEDDWFHGVARVRGRMHHLENVVLLSGSLPGATAPTLTPLQLPHEAAQPWLALEIPKDYEVTSERLLYTASLGAGFDPTAPVCGLLIDEWTEVIPSRLQTTGVAFHHDRPNAEPPQAWLLAVPAVFDEAWSWDDLIGAVNDALDSAKLRAIEPVHLDTTPYDALVPATHSAWTYPEISISNNLLRNVKIYDKVIQER